VVEAVVEEDERRNEMCRSLGSFGPIREIAGSAQAFLETFPFRLAHPEVSAWLDGSRLNAANVPAELQGDPEVAAALATMFEHLGPATENLPRLTAA
jgi:hypothetical protein